MPPTIILVRHAQALHNVDKDYTLHDPELSELGRQQCAELKEKLMPRIPKDLDVGLIIVSPMKRTIETALLAFGELVERGVPIVAHAGWQETSLQPCDTGTPLPLLQPLFPQVDFTHVDPLFPDKTSSAAAPLYGHSRQAVLRRGQSVLRELRARTEKAVLVVSHSGFLRTGVTGCYYMNGDWRVFEFEEGDEGEEREGEGGEDRKVDGEGEVKLRQWDETSKGGGMGWSWEKRVPLGDGLPEEEDGGDGDVDGGGNTGKEGAAGEV